MTVVIFVYTVLTWFYARGQSDLATRATIWESGGSYFVIQCIPSRLNAQRACKQIHDTESI